MRLRVVAIALGSMAGLSPVGAETWDAVFFRDGSDQVAHVLGRGVDSMRMRLPQIAGGRGSAVVTVSLERVERVEFGLTLEEQWLGALAVNPDQLEAAWGRWASFLDLPRSPAAEIGLEFGRQLLAEATPEQVGRALGVFRMIENRAWAERSRLLAKQGRLRALLALGQADQAIEEAERLSADSDDPEILIEARLILAAGQHQDLVDFLEENPRWQEDPRVRDDYARLVHGTLDAYLFPYLFHGSEAAPAARGLLGAIEVYRLTGNQALLEATARDLVLLYAGTPEAATAAKELPTPLSPEPPNTPDHEP